MPQLQTWYLAACAAFVALYWLAPRRAQPWLLAAASTGLLAWLDWQSWLVASAGAVVAWAGSREGTRWRATPVLLALILLFCVVRAGEVLGAELPGAWTIVAPLGFGFYMLRLAHYRVEQLRGTFRPHRLLDVYSYLLFFPTVLIGPIHRFDVWQREGRRRRWDPALVAEGLERVLYGYVKVVALAHWLVWNRGLFVDLDGWMPAAVTLFECLQYGLYLYFAFAGYSDIAIGLSRLLGVRVGENFRWPYLQRNIGEFWRSWHISLSEWCRRYVFLPVMARWRAPTAAVFASMVVLGLWHAFTWQYLLWGAYHAAGIAIFRLWQRVAPQPTGPVAAHAAHAAAVVVTFCFVMLGFVITKNASLEAVAVVLQELAQGWGPP